MDPFPLPGIGAHIDLLVSPSIAKVLLHDYHVTGEEGGGFFTLSVCSRLRR